jgi:hypothetical protein
MLGQALAGHHREREAEDLARASLRSASQTSSEGRHQGKSKDAPWLPGKGGQRASARESKSFSASSRFNAVSNGCPGDCGRSEAETKASSCRSRFRLPRALLRS